MEMNELFRKLFTPSSIAIVGASRTPGKVGYDILFNVIKCGFSGKIYPINPSADAILGVKCYKNILELPETPDLVIMAIPAERVLEVAEDCGKKGVKILTIISAGFREIGGEGGEREKKLLKICKKYGIRVQGPNCLGVINTDPPLNASFAMQIPTKGNVAFVSQSGALGTSILDWSSAIGFGFSKFVSLGNKMDLDETDFLNALLSDDHTRVIVMYIEDVKNGEKFIKTAEKAVRRKPVIILKSGQTPEGVKAATSHTGALAGSDTAYETAFNQVGVIRVNKIRDLFDYAFIFSTQPLPENRNVGIVTNAGGPGIIAADAVSTYNLKMARLEKETLKKLRENLPPNASVINPIDILGDAKADRYVSALKILVHDPNVGSIIVILTPQRPTDPVGTAKAIVEISKTVNKPITAVFMGGSSIKSAREILLDAGIPCYSFPEDAISSLEALIRYKEYISAPIKHPPPKFKVEVEKVKEVINRVYADGRLTLLEHEANEILLSYGINVPETILAQDSDEAVEFAEEIGYPVALKVASPQILHKSDIGGVRLNLMNAEEVRRAFINIIVNARNYLPDARIYGVVVQKQVKLGRELIIGVKKDIQFGHLIMFGLGGIYVNFLKDVAFKIAPLTVEDAHEIVKQTKAYTLLKGVRGEKQADINAVIETILRVSQLVTDFSEIVEMDLNPLFAYSEGEGCIAVDAKVTLSHKRKGSIIHIVFNT
ncbi:MAG: acetate--CoA ligase alpha subunit [Candidatus Odinarchaeia archaeon]